MTRNQAIRILVGIFSGLMAKVANPQEMSTTKDVVFHAGGIGPGEAATPLAEMSFGDREDSTPEAIAKRKTDHDNCMKERERLSVNGASNFTCMAIENPKRIPGTARLVLHLDGWKEFEVAHGGKSVKISRDEIWKALQ